MSALLAGELRRVLARRLVRVVFALVAIGIVVAGGVVFLKTHHLSEAAYQARVKGAYDPAAVFNAPPGLRVCPIGPQGEPVTAGPGNSCVPLEVGVHDPRFHLTQLRGVFEGVTAPLAILACLIGASVIGAEWPSRTITTILTWEPRRSRVHTAKVLVAIAVTVALTLVGLVVLGLALLPSALLHGTTAGTNGAWWTSLGGVLLRSMAMTAIAAMIGFSIASVGRNTAAALGLLFAYVVVIERVVAIFLHGLMRWLIIGNAAVFVTGQRNDVAHGQSVIVAGLYLAAIALGLYVIATAVFQHRDVA